jgi:hypothetical protein
MKRTKRKKGTERSTGTKRSKGSKRSKRIKTVYSCNGKLDQDKFEFLWTPHLRRDTINKNDVNNQCSTEKVVNAMRKKDVLTV